MFTRIKKAKTSSGKTREYFLSTVPLANAKFSSKDIALYYKGLWQIEAGFRNLKQADKGASYLEVFNIVKEIKAVKLTEGKKKIIFRTEFPNKAHIAFKALGIAPPPRIISFNNLKV